MTKNLALWLILVLALSYGVFQSINQLNQLAKVNGIGDKTLEKAFAFMLNDESKKQYMQKDLF